MTRRILYLPALIVAVVLLACVATLLALSEKAEAAFPGKNGRIAYASYAERCRPCIVGYPGYDPEIYTINPNGTGKFQLTRNNEDDLDPSYSPNGKKIAYEVWRTHLEIYTMNVGGGSKTQLTHNNKDDFDPSYSPNRQKDRLQRLGRLG